MRNNGFATHAWQKFRWKGWSVNRTMLAGELHAAYGVMGGYMQPQGHFQVLSNLVDFAMAPQQALDMPRWQLMGPGAGLGAREEGGLVAMEEGWSFATLAELARRGHR